MVSRSKWDETVAERAKALAARQTVTARPGGRAAASSRRRSPTTAIAYRYVELDDRPRRAHRRADRPRPRRAAARRARIRAAPSSWSLRAFRELDDALLRLRFDLPEIGVVTVRTARRSRRWSSRTTRRSRRRPTGFAREVRLLQRRVLKRFDNTARSFYAVADRADSCFAGSLLELALGADRFYMLIDEAEQIARRDLGRERRAS